MEVLVVGAGAMGRWAGETLAAEFDVAYADRNPEAATDAAAGSGGRAVSTDAEETFDAVCLAVPISAVAEAVRTHAPRAERAMVDVTGVMDAPVASMRTALPDRERASLHPLFAPENAPGNVAVVADSPGPVTDAILDAVTDAGNRVFETTAAEHDAAMETVQSGAHAAVLAYALVAADVREEFATPVSAALDDLVATVTSGTPRVYREIQESFPGADRVAAAARRIADAEGEAFDDLYDEAGAKARSGSTGRATPSGERTERDASDSDGAGR